MPASAQAVAASASASPKLPYSETQSKTQPPSPAEAGSAETDATADGTVFEGFPSKQAADIVGISYRQLDHWARQGLVQPSVNEADGSGSRRRYSYSDLLELKIAKKLRDHGQDLQAIAGAFSYLRNDPRGKVASANIVFSGSDVLWADDDVVLSLLHQGQAVMLVLQVAEVRRELDADVVNMAPQETDAVQLQLEIAAADPDA